MEITIKDIAKKVGTVPSTVSRALNNKNGVSERTRIQILETAKRMGYFPNATARGLVLSKTENLGFLVNRRQSLSPSAFYGEIMEGVETVAQEKSYHLLFSTSDSKTLPSVIQAKRVDGLILAGCDFSKNFILSLKRKKIPLVLVDNHLAIDEVDSVIIDNVGGAYQAVSHLVKLGHRKIGFIAERFADLSFAERFAGYRQALEAQGIGYDQTLVAEVQGLEKPGDRGRYEDTTAYGRVVMNHLLERGAPTAVFAANDAAATGAIRAIKERGLRVAEDVAVVGFDDGFFAYHTDPLLTTVRVFRDQMGLMAANRLLELIANPGQPSAQIKLATRLIVRESCGELGR